MIVEGMWKRGVPAPESGRLPHVSGNTLRVRLRIEPFPSDRCSVEFGGRVATHSLLSLQKSSRIRHLAVPAGLAGNTWASQRAMRRTGSEAVRKLD